MAHKTFISYKFSDARDTKDRLITALGADAKFYQGEKGYHDMSDYASNTIKNYLSDMLFDTSVTIVVLSKNVVNSEWVKWEIQHSLRKETRNGRSSNANGIVAVVQKDCTLGYSWAYRSLEDIIEYRSNVLALDGYTRISHKFIPEMLLANMNNLNAMGLNSLYYAMNNISSSYVDVITEDDFILSPSRYIENAFLKASNIEDYDIRLSV